MKDKERYFSVKNQLSELKKDKIKKPIRRSLIGFCYVLVMKLYGLYLVYIIFCFIFVISV